MQDLAGFSKEKAWKVISHLSAENQLAVVKMGS